MAQAADNRPPARLRALVSEVLACRGRLQAEADTAGKLGDALAYDVALARLCDRLGLDHELAGESAGPLARRQAEVLVADSVPTLRDSFAERGGALAKDGTSGP
jgi:hypothetical protein